MPTVTETPAIRQAVLSPEKHLERAAEHLYMFMRPVDGPAWDDLHPLDQSSARVAVMIGGASIPARIFRTKGGR